MYNYLKNYYDDFVNISDDWLDVEKWELKILILTSMLADNNLAFRGTLKTMRDWFGIKSGNNSAIKRAIDSLVEKEYIFCNVEGRTYHISIRDKGLKDKEVKKIRKCWINNIKNYNNSNVSWITRLKVFIYLYSKGSIYTTQEELSNQLCISVETLRKTINDIQDCELDGISLDFSVEKDSFVNSNGDYIFRNTGSNYIFGYDWS